MSGDSIMEVSRLEEYLREKYGILSIIKEKRQDILDELEKMRARRRRRRDEAGGEDWRRDLDNLVLDSDLRQYFVGESVKYKDGRVVSESKNLLVMIVRSYDCLRSRKSSQGVEDEDVQDGDWGDLVDDEEFVVDLGGGRDGKSGRLGGDGAKSGRGQRGKLKKRILYFVLTTGRAAVPSSKQGDGQKSDTVIINAMEYERLNDAGFGESLMHPGTKLMLRMQQEGTEALQVQNSMLLLRNCNLRILGGNVESLVEAWRLNNLLSRSGSRSFFSGSKNLTRKPPKFIPFVNKESERRQLIEQVKDAQQSYQQSKESRQSNLKSVPSSGGSSSSNAAGDETTGEESKKNNSLFEASIKAYNEFIERIHEYKRRNFVSLEKFHLLKSGGKTGEKDLASSKKGTNVSSNKLKLHDDLDPGAPLRGRLLRSTEKIDSDAREFLKPRGEASSKITLFDHLFSKLEIKNALGTGIDDSISEEQVERGVGGVGVGGREGGRGGGRGGRGGRGGGRGGGKR